MLERRRCGARPERSRQLLQESPRRSARAARAARGNMGPPGNRRAARRGCALPAGPTSGARSSGLADATRVGRADPGELPAASKSRQPRGSRQDAGSVFRSSRSRGAPLRDAPARVGSRRSGRRLSRRRVTAGTPRRAGRARSADDEARTGAGRSSARRSATAPPIECPRSTGRARPQRARNAATKPAMRSIEPRLSRPPERPWPGRSRASGLCSAARASSTAANRAPLPPLQCRQTTVSPRERSGTTSGSVVRPTWWT
jgi:hypothetical protein